MVPCGPWHCAPLIRYSGGFQPQIWTLSLALALFTSSSVFLGFSATNMDFVIWQGVCVLGGGGMTFLTSYTSETAEWNLMKFNRFFSKMTQLLYSQISDLLGALYRVNMKTQQLQ